VQVFGQQDAMNIAIADLAHLGRVNAFTRWQPGAVMSALAGTKRT
jgi:hypothetical protein